MPEITNALENLATAYIGMPRHVEAGLRTLGHTTVPFHPEPLLGEKSPRMRWTGSWLSTMRLVGDLEDKMMGVASDGQVATVLPRVDLQLPRGLQKDVREVAQLQAENLRDTVTRALFLRTVEGARAKGMPLDEKWLKTEGIAGPDALRETIAELYEKTIPEQAESLARLLSGKESPIKFWGKRGRYAARSGGAQRPARAESSTAQVQGVDPQHAVEPRKMPSWQKGVVIIGAASVLVPGCSSVSPTPAPTEIRPTHPSPTAKAEVPPPKTTQVPNTTKPRAGGEYPADLLARIEGNEFKNQEDALSRWVQWWGSAAAGRPFSLVALPNEPGQSAELHFKYIVDTKTGDVRVTMESTAANYVGYVIDHPVNTATGEFIAEPPAFELGHTIPDELKPTFLSVEITQKDIDGGIAPKELLGSILDLRNGQWIRVNDAGQEVGFLNMKTGKWEASPTPTQEAPFSQDETVWISDEIIGFEENGAKTSFGFELAADTKLDTVRNFLEEWRVKLVQYASENKLENPPTFTDFDINPNNAEAKRNIAMTATLGFLETYNLQNNTKITLAEFTAHPETYPFKVWTADNQVTTLTMDQIKKIKLELTSQSVERGSTQLYMHVGKASSYGLGYSFDGNTFTFYLPFDRTNINRWLTPNEKYPNIIPDNIRYLYPALLFSIYGYAASELPFSAYQYDNKNRDMTPQLNAKVDPMRERIADGGHLPDIYSPWFETVVAPYKEKYAGNEGASGMADFDRTYGFWVAR